MDDDNVEDDYDNDDDDNGDDDNDDNDDNDDDDDDEAERMGSVLLLCYGNRAAIAPHRPISAMEKRISDHLMMIMMLYCLFW